MEIIAYDCYTSSDLSEVKIHTSPEVILLTKSFDYDSYLGYSPFNDPVFTKQYAKEMDIYLNTPRINQILKKHEAEIAFYSEMLQEEYSYFNYDESFMLGAIEELKHNWTDVKRKLLDGEIKAKLDIEDYNYTDIPPIEGMSLQAFAASPYELHVRNFHSEKLYLVAYKSKKLPEQGLITFEEAIEFPPYST